MRPFHVFIVFFITLFTLLIMFNIGAFLQGMFSVSLKLETQNTSYVNQYNSATNSFATLGNIVIVIGLILTFVVLVLYERNR